MNNITTSASPLSAPLQEELLGIAIAAIRYGLVNQTVMPINLEGYDSRLQTPQASFVTLKKQGQLRGCIGSLDARRPLVEDVIENAWQAAFKDPRFPAVQSNELSSLHISISVLSPPSKMSVLSEQDLINQLRPGVDGLIIEDPHHRATFLPSVWQQLPEPGDFIRQLKLKAGLAANEWPSSLAVKRYTSFEFGTMIANTEA